MEKEKVKIELIKGIEGNSLYLIGYRIAGNKPWGGGKLLESWGITIEEVLLVIANNQKEDKKVYNVWYNNDYKITIERIKN